MASEDTLKSIVGEKTIEIPAFIWEQLVYSIDECIIHADFCLKYVDDYAPDVAVSIEEYKNSRELLIESLNRACASAPGGAGVRARIAVEQSRP